MTGTPTQNHVIIYTDGAAEPNPGPGGYGVVLLSGKHRKELSGGFARTTNNRMELLGVIAGLEALSRPCNVTVHSDSKYVVDSVQRGSVAKWKSKGWKVSTGDRAKNVDLWERFLAVASKHKVQMVWVKGHAGIEENERCDVLAVEAAKIGTERDEGYMDELALSKQKEHQLQSSFNDQSAHQSGDHSMTNKNKADSSSAIDSCRKCGGKLERKPTKSKALRADQLFYYEWLLVCTKCHTTFLDEKAKRTISKS